MGYNATANANAFSFCQFLTFLLRVDTSRGRVQRDTTGSCGGSKSKSATTASGGHRITQVVVTCDGAATVAAGTSTVTGGENGIDIGDLWAHLFRPEQ